MRARHWTIAALLGVLAIVTVTVAWRIIDRYADWLHDGAPRVGPIIVLGPKDMNGVQHRPQSDGAAGRAEFREHDRVFHNEFGHGTIVATEGSKLTIRFDHGGMKRVIDSFVVRSEDRPGAH